MRFPELLRDVLDFCYPPACCACRGDCPSGQFVCSQCDAALRALEARPACACCAMPLALEGLPCPRCAGRGVAHFDHIVALGRYAEPLTGLIHHMKYHGGWPIAEHLADRMLHLNRTRILVGEADCLLPVPLHRLRQTTRGYNQAEVAAAQLARCSGVRLVHPAVRRRYTPTQTALHSRAERFANLRGAFRLRDAGAIHGRRVVVIDDVTTTGATLQTLARALRPARPKSLSALVFAVADPRGRDFGAI